MKTVKSLKKYIVAAIAALLVLIVASNCVGVVPTNHTGVWKRLGVVQETAVKEGLHLKIPFVDSIESISNQVQTATVFGSQTDSKATTKETAETKDQQLIMSYIFEVQYQLESSKSFVIYKNYGTNYEKTLIINNVLPAIKQAFAKYNSEEITTNKENIAQTVKDQLGEYTKQFGINIMKVNFISYDFTAEYNAILEERAALKAQVVNEELRQNQQRVAAQTAYDVAVKNAEKEAESARIAAENAKAVALIEADRDKETRIINANADAEAKRISADNDAYVKITVANADRDARLAAAEATKAEIAARANGLNDLVIQEAFIEKWDGKLIPSFGDSSSLNFANLTEIYKKYLDLE